MSSHGHMEDYKKHLAEPHIKTYLVTKWIFTPKTPDCFRDGIRFKLNSLLLNFIDSFTSIYVRSKKALDDLLFYIIQVYYTYKKHLALSTSRLNMVSN